MEDLFYIKIFTAHRTVNHSQLCIPNRVLGEERSQGIQSEASTRGQVRASVSGGLLLLLPFTLAQYTLEDVHLFMECTEAVSIRVS